MTGSRAGAAIVIMVLGWAGTAYPQTGNATAAWVNAVDARITRSLNEPADRWKIRSAAQQRSLLRATAATDARARVAQGPFQKTSRPRSITRKIIGGAVCGFAGFMIGGVIGGRIGEATAGNACDECDGPILQGVMIGAPIGAALGAIVGVKYF